MTTYGLQELNQMKQQMWNSALYVNHVQSVSVVQNGLLPIHSQPSSPPGNGMDKTCPHWDCNLDWHSAPVTQRIANMFHSHTFDPDYDPDEDDSGVVCVGSEFYGPQWSSSYGGASDPWASMVWPKYDSGPSWQQIVAGEPYAPMYPKVDNGWHLVGAVKDDELSKWSYHYQEQFAPSPLQSLQKKIKGLEEAFTILTLGSYLPEDTLEPLTCKTWLPGDAPIEFGPENWVTKHEWFPYGFPQPAIEAAKEILEAAKYPPNITPWGDLSDFIEKTAKEINDSFKKGKKA